MNARFIMLVGVVTLVASTGCSGLGLFGNGAPCGPACMGAAAPAYDYVPHNYANECVCGTDGYVGYGSGVVHEGYVGDVGGYTDYGYPVDQWQPSAGSYNGGIITSPPSPTNMAPVPQPSPANPQ
ncbi:MAG: hypothetical protein R3C05_31370 [Pirellulaceae bacterium]